MPRPLVYGNGRFLIAFDRRHQARDLFWPNVGHPNDLLGNAMRVGVWADGQFSWCDSEAWEIRQSLRVGSPVGESLWRSWSCGLEIQVEEALDPEEPVFLRRLVLRDLRGMAREVRVFFTQNFVLGQSDVGNTAFYDPFHDCVVHYRGRSALALRARTESGGIHQYATGITGFGDLKGTWMDAEDGELSGNPIAQGSVDSTFSVAVGLAPQGERTLDFALAAGHRLGEATRLLSAPRTFESVAARATSDATQWLEKCTADVRALPPEVQAAFWRSLLVMRTQVDSDGAILAANDSDILETNRATYSYCWPRDGALVAMAFARVGHPDILVRFLEFCGSLVEDERPFLLQKYRSDGALGASWHPWVVDGVPTVPFQQDETALVLLAMERCPLPQRGKLWNAYGSRFGEFLLQYRDGQGLPQPSYDLWEERRGVHFFTVCSVIAALEACFRMTDDSRYKEAAATMLTAADTRLFCTNLGRYKRSLQPDPTPDSAILGGLLLNPERWAHASETVQSLMEELAVGGDIGGYSRYSGDYYFRRSHKHPGNPWVISTMWVARHLAALGRFDEALGLLQWAVDRAETTGVLAEQFHPETGEPLSVSPLTWSHTEFVEACLDVATGL